VDTDEFDQAWSGTNSDTILQYAASYSDNPGGAIPRRTGEGPPAYGEGLTGIGGLLAKSKYYSIPAAPIRPAAERHLPGHCAGGRNPVGFYAENAIA
jgi:hypothetical protein